MLNERPSGTIAFGLARFYCNVNFILEKLVDWCHFNKMALNPTKCEFMLLTNKHILSEPIIKLRGQVLNRVNSFKYLGIYVDDKFKFNHHVDHLKARLSQFCGITFRLRRYFNATSAKALYCSCAFSLIAYCITVWGSVWVGEVHFHSWNALKLIISTNLFIRGITCLKNWKILATTLSV